MKSRRVRREEAAERQARRDARTDEQQLALNIKRGGNPEGRESKRLRARITRKRSS